MPDALTGVDDALLSVILAGQRSAGGQRTGRYAPGASQHPARMLPHLAAHLIRDYTQPGDWVFDPLAGTGTTPRRSDPPGPQRRRCGTRTPVG